MKENPGNLDIHNRQKRLNSARRLLDEYGKERETEKITGKCVIGFLDKASPQATDNKQRFWSFK